MTIDTVSSTPSSTEETRPSKSAKLTHTTSTMSSSSSALRLLVQRHPAHPLAKLPTRGSALAAGYDLYSAEKVVVPRGGRKVVQTGICLAIPTGHYGRVAPRSGLASKHGIDTGAGVIDEDYRGLLGVLLFNFGDADFTSKYPHTSVRNIESRADTADMFACFGASRSQRGRPNRAAHHRKDLDTRGGRSRKPRRDAARSPGRVPMRRR